MAATAQDVPLSVAEQLAAQQDKVDAFLALVGEDTLDKSMVGQGKLRDVWILRFLIGFKWKVAECAEKFKTMIAYRVQFGCDDVRKKMEAGQVKPSDFPGYAEHHAGYECSFDLCSGRTRTGAPISIECTPKFDFASLFAIDLRTQDLYMMYTFEWHFYLIDMLYLKTGQLFGYVKIFDLDGCKMSQVSVVNQWRAHSIDRQKRLRINVLECYPECYSKVLVVNAPSFFAVLWKMVKPFLPARTADKVKVESNKSAAKKKLHELIDPSVLPSFLGGDYTGEWRMK